MRQSKLDKRSKELQQHSNSEEQARSAEEIVQEIDHQDAENFLNYIHDFDPAQLTPESEKVLRAMVATNVQEMQESLVFFMVRLATASYMRGWFDAVTSKETGNLDQFKDFISGLDNLNNEE